MLTGGHAAVAVTVTATRCTPHGLTASVQLGDCPLRLRARVSPAASQPASWRAPVRITAAGPRGLSAAAGDGTGISSFPAPAAAVTRPTPSRAVAPNPGPRILQLLMHPVQRRQGPRGCTAGTARRAPAARRPPATAGPAFMRLTGPGPVRVDPVPACRPPWRAPPRRVPGADEGVGRGGKRESTCGRGQEVCVCVCVFAGGAARGAGQRSAAAAGAAAAAAGDGRGVQAVERAWVSWASWVSSSSFRFASSACKATPPPPPPGRARTAPREEGEGAREARGTGARKVRFRRGLGRRKEEGREIS